MTRRNQLTGSHGENLAHSTLDGLGVILFGKVETPKSLVHSQLKFTRRVAGDLFGMLPNGEAVLVEVKTTEEDNLTWSDFRPHQIVNLDLCAKNNGVPLVVWINEPHVYVMRWPVAELKPGKGLTPERASAYHFWTVAHIREVVESSVRYVDLSEVT